MNPLVKNVLVCIAACAAAFMLTGAAPARATEADGATMMRAVVYRTYGPPDVLRVEQVAKPVWNRKRVSLAESVLRDPQSMAVRFALIVAANDVPLAATDQELETQVRDAWDAIAGVELADKS